jgi:hypothetical protein
MLGYGSFLDGFTGKAKSHDPKDGGFFHAVNLTSGTEIFELSSREIF